MPETVQISGTNEGSGDSSKQTGHGNTLKPNTVLLRRYKILGVLGGGGMGTVYQARDLNFPNVKRLTAIKEMLTPSSDRALREQSLQTFQREANILATLTHPAIPKIYDFFDQNEKAYLVQEYINGSDLEVLLQKTKKLPIDKIIEWAIDLCEVLDYLHSHQPDPIVFRDMKPSNVMIDSLGKVRLIDFGIAKQFISTGKPHTMIGTEGYSAPEQYKGNVSPLSDQYSLGATLHHILTRKDPRLEPPFSFHERPIREHNGEVPQWLADVLSRSLEFNPQDRFPSCGEMAEAIRNGRNNAIAVDANENPTKYIDPGKEIEPKWIFKTEDEVRTSPSMHNGVVFIGSYDTNVWALNLEDGELIWKFPTQGGIASSPVVDRNAGLVMFGSEDHTFNAVNYKTGRIVWSFTTKDRIRGTAALAMDHVFFGSDDGFLYALVSANGRNLWRYDAQTPIRSRPLITDELIIFGTDLGEVTAITLSGDRRWSYRTRRSVVASPSIDPDEGVCFIGSHDGFLYALDANSGYSSWRFRTMGPIISTPALHNEMVVFGSVDKTLYAIDSVTSREKWQFNIDEPIVSSPVVHNNNVYVGGTDGYLYCIDAKLGEENWKFKTDGPITSTPLIVGDTLIFGSLDHKVYALPIFN